MDPVTILLIGVAAVVAVSTVTYAMVRRWIDSNRVPAGTATIVKRQISTGKYHVVAGVFDKTGRLRKDKVWKANEVDAELTRRLDEAGGTIVVHT